MINNSVALHRPFRDRSFGLVRKFLAINWLFVLCVCLLAGVGYTALYSAAGGASQPYANSQLYRFLTALLMMLVIAMVDIRIIARLSWVSYAIGVVLLLVVMKFGHTGLGAKRWMTLGGVEIQPSELMKLFLTLALASYFCRASHERVGNILFLLPAVAVVLLPVALILKEPNLGTAVITALIGASVMYGAGVRWSKIALGSGGFSGQGYLHGTQNQLNFLPEKQTDFVFTIIAEEFGFIGSMAVLALLFSIVGIALYTALRCQHQFGRLVALGIGANFFLYCFVNLSMVMGLIPVGGVPLPLISYGGSALTAVMLGFGVLMSVHVHRDVEFAVQDF
jgi:rod shape determining protein RodA